MIVGNRVFKPFIPEADILKRVKEIGTDISRDYADKDPLFLILLNGAFLFAADLIKEVRVPCQVSFIKLSSYSGTESTGNVCQLIGLSENLKDRHVILVDDIVDTGLTMTKVIDSVSKEGPASLAVTSLLLKPDSFQGGFEVHYVGFSIPDRFVVGYGLDYDGYGRNLRDIFQIAD
jgi:hypoxanthine phosphoribosyltransferase